MGKKICALLVESTPNERALRLNTCSICTRRTGQHTRKSIPPPCRLVLSLLRRTNQSTSGSVAALLADGGFLKWDFNVFTLEERSRGHSLWCVPKSIADFLSL